jgi:transposase
MAGKLKSMSKVKQIVQFHLQGKPIKWIARTTNVSKNTVRKYIALSCKSAMAPQELLKLADVELEAELLPEQETTRDERHNYLTDRYDDIVLELKKTGVTRFLLWSEYRYSCPGGYSYSQFCWHLQQLDKQNNVSAIINHEPGDLLYVDFTGKLMKYVNLDTGEIIKTQVLVATLGYSQYSYVEAVHSQKAEDFVGALSRAMAFFGRVPKAIVPDNLKSAVVKSDRYEPGINLLLDDFANHYGTTIIPARVASPKDKSLAENMVKHAYRKIYAPLRNREFYSLVDLNTAILEKLADYHNCKFQARDYSRQDLFELEKQHLQPLPELAFEIKKRREVTVQKNSHVF